MRTLERLIVLGWVNDTGQSWESQLRAPAPVSSDRSHYQWKEERRRLQPAILVDIDDEDLLFVSEREDLQRHVSSRSSLGFTGIWIAKINGGQRQPFESHSFCNPAECDYL